MQSPQKKKESNISQAEEDGRQGDRHVASEHFSQDIAKVPPILVSHSMKRLVLTTLIFVAGCATFVPSADPVSRLHKDIDAVLSDTLFDHTLAAIKVVSLNSGKVLYDRNSSLLVHPASNLKLFTSSSALGYLGPGFLFKTRVLTDSTLSDSALGGNVYLKGYGDPDLSVSDLDSLATVVRSLGIRRVNGNIVADGSYFDDLYWGNGWMWDDEPEPDEMFISALSVNKNCVTVTVAPDTLAGDSVYVAVDPPTSYVSVRNTAKSVADTNDTTLKITRLFKERLNTVDVSGDVPRAWKPIHKRMSIWQPAMFAGQLFKEALVRDSIAVPGNVVQGTAPGSAFRLAEIDRPIDSVIVHMNKVSDNLSAENLLKTLCAERDTVPGSASPGIALEYKFLSSLGVDTTSCNVVDGSGVSHYDLVTVDNIIRLLTAIAHRPEPFRLIYQSLPVAGVDGTLDTRMIGTNAQGTVRAKTGSLSGISSLSGYVTTQDGELLAFSMVMENFALPSKYYRAAQDSICTYLARFGTSPPVSSSH